MSENEDKYHDTVLDLEAKLKKNVDLILKLGNSLQGMFMLGPKPLSVYDQQLKHGLGYPNPYTLKQAISQCPKLYLASSLGNSKISLNVRDTEDTLDDASKSQQKVYEKMNDPIAVANKQNCWTIDYAQINALYKDFVPQKELSAEQKYFPSSFIPSDKNSNATPSIPASMPNNSLHAEIEQLRKKSIEIQEGLQAKIKILEKDVQRCEKQKRDNDKLEYQKLFNSIKTTQSQTQTEMDELIAHVSEKTYAYGAIRAENQNLLFTISELKTRLANVEKGMNAASSVRRPMNMNKDSHVKNSILANSKKPAKKVAVYVRKNKQTDITSENVISNKENAIDVDVANASKAKTLLCVSCMQNVLIPCHDNCFANYKLNVHSNVRRPLSTKSRTPKSYDTTYVVRKTRFSKESTLSKYLDTTYVVSKPKIDVESTSKANDNVYRTNKRNVRDKSFSTYMKNKIQTSRIWKKWFESKPNVVWSPVNTNPNGQNNRLSEKQSVFVKKWHMMGDRSLLKNFIEKFMGTIRFGNDNFAAITGYDHLCSACERGKIKKASHPLKLVPSDHSKLELLHMDLCGLMRVASINGKKYILVIVDDYSRYTWVYFLHSKDETPEIIKKFIAQAQLNYKAKVCKIRTDNGTEFKNATLKAHYEKLGIMQQFSTARTPQQNGVVERRNRTLVEAARTMLKFSRLPEFLWAKAVATACFTQNRSIIHTRHNKTPYELLRGRKPNVEYFHVFGSLCYPTNDRDDLGKMKPKADIGVFIGYSETSRGFRIYNRRTKKIMETINVKFDELTAMASEHDCLEPELQRFINHNSSAEHEKKVPVDHYSDSAVDFQPPAVAGFEEVIFPLILSGNPRVYLLIFFFQWATIMTHQGTYGNDCCMPLNGHLLSRVRRPELLLILWIVGWPEGSIP
ncbi:retrovirus-related pol polyprotein from transposon TNT 1-94 [Tanacetum coccineum]